MYYVDILNQAANILIGVGTLVSILFGLKISPSSIETNFINGKPKNNALVEIRSSLLLKVGLVLLFLGSVVQIILNIYQLLCQK
ncbi:MAG: hypothetical protein A2998_01180 [Candidatus Staskawiczbacteria bacterium RIFCSPLOWO2_01_FULL_37_25b]|uniref:Uncharacterized protein n=2 Tax=Candidatus Staskawicziibacteriota TaxID=1817916 RepID=A0A1G2HRW1_9BACT|nr:MAG: hypothetical protein A2812_02865 [Candidatus Staskawiczbacteria bacterium RIFCSPHIGHO2_01_FULL_36_16]OGZ72381.1 MAG: hypothetical protein A2998_01180 [Candidatus Staskawiczbacteria bacterium RIFCSPLOWO2_01_FULL_37_25b]